MDIRFGDQLVAITATLVSLVVAVVAVALMVRHGAAVVSCYFGAGLVVFASVRLAFGLAVRPRTRSAVTLTAAPADDPED